MVQYMADGTGHYTQKDISRELDSLFEKLSKKLDDLLELLDQAIPTASYAAELGNNMMQALTLERHSLTKQKEGKSLWRSVLDRNTFQSRQLNRDLDLVKLRSAFFFT